VSAGAFLVLLRGIAFAFYSPYDTGMGIALPKLPILARVIPASRLPTAAPSRAAVWSLTNLAGRLVELSAGAEAAHLTAAFGLVLDAQLGGDGAAWVTLEHSSFFPPDVVHSGVDPDALPVVRAPDMRSAGRAADHLVRSGGFGLVVIDLSSEMESEKIRVTNRFPMPLLTRLLGLARKQNVAALFLTKKSSVFHSLISLRAEARWRKVDGRYELFVRVLKDKRGGLGWTHVEACRGPAGLR